MHLIFITLKMHIGSPNFRFRFAAALVVCMNLFCNTFHALDSWVMGGSVLGNAIVKEWLWIALSLVPADFEIAIFKLSIDRIYDVTSANRFRISICNPSNMLLESRWSMGDITLLLCQHISSTVFHISIICNITRVVISNATAAASATSTARIAYASIFFRFIEKTTNVQWKTILRNAQNNGEATFCQRMLRCVQRSQQ